MKRNVSSLRARSALMAATVLLAGCEQVPVAKPRPAVVHRPVPVAHNMRREAAMNEQWQNHRYSELVAAMGRPTMVMNIPGGGNPPGFAVVFGQDPVSGCIDAFALMYASDPIVRQYHCR